MLRRLASVLRAYGAPHAPSGDETRASAPSGERSRPSLRSCRELQCFAPPALATSAYGPRFARICFAALAATLDYFPPFSRQLCFAPSKKKRKKIAFLTFWNFEILNFRIFEFGILEF